MIEAVEDHRDDLADLAETDLPAANLAETLLEYDIESEGQHQLQLHPERHEVPVNEEVEIDVMVGITEPQ